MNYHTKAVYHGGVFVPAAQCNLPEDAEVDLRVQGPLQTPAVVTDPEQRLDALRQVTARMKKNALPPQAPRFTRDDLHERR
jgi:hypothetical protein